jgi:hypothetical protein
MHSATVLQRVMKGEKKLENVGIDPTASSLLTKRSTISERRERETRMMNNRDLSAPQESASLAAGDRARRLPSPSLAHVLTTT